MDYREVSDIRDGMRIDWDMPITMNDGLVLRCDVFRPVKKGRYPVLLSYGPYGKWLHFEDGYATAWNRMVEKHPDEKVDAKLLKDRALARLLMLWVWRERLMPIQRWW